MRLLLLAAFYVAWAASASAQTSSSIEVGHPWARATAASGVNGAVYLTLTNRGTTDDRLTGASTPVAAKTQLHATINDNGVMKMRPVAEVPLKAGGSAEFKPGGMHIMLLGLKHPLAVGDSFPLTLTFDKAGAVETMVMIEKAGAPASNSMPGMKM
ncbi:MAG TPA: copper chaperone PCu(A)C [Stellaceae bacterium]|nr:copper chaperone PCu(A)C [Stellaceae bacterium]